MSVEVVDQASAYQALQEAAGDIQDALRWIEANGGDEEVLALHSILTRVATRAEQKFGLTSGSLSNPHPLDGDPKN